jgi:hypothetical protein
MNRHGMTFAALVLASSLASAASAFAQGSIGGPTKQTGLGQPTKPPSPLVPGQKTGTVTVPPNNSSVANNSTVKKKK